MKRMIKRLIMLVVMTTGLTPSFAQYFCTPVGFATQNGGTTGGGSASPITVTTLANLTTQANGSGSRVIYVSGTMGAGEGTRVKVASNTTIIGLPGAKLYGGFDLRGSNIIIRNMIVQGPGSEDVDGIDCISIDGSTTTNVWIDHCDVYDGQDGNMDITNGASYVTVTWTKFRYTSASSDHQFSSLIGNSDSKTSDRGKLKCTFMYNYWTTGCVERMPRLRFGQVHVVNNLFDSPQADYCVRAGIEADLLVESNYFDAVNEPIDLYENNFTAVTSRNNVFNNTTGNTSGSGTSFTPPYSLSITAAANIKALVSNASCGAGATLTSPTSCGCSSNPTSYALTTAASPTAGGTITRSPNATTYASGTVVTLTATAASGYTFTGWSGGASGANTTTTVTINANTTVTANFTTSTGTTYTLTTTASPAAGGTITRSPNATSYAAGTVVTLTATPASGYAFSSWSGGASGTSATTTVTINAATSVTANFATTGGTGTTLRIDDKSGTGTGYCSADGSRQSTYTGADGGYYVNLSNSSGKGITWAVRAGAAGTYTIRWRYSNSGTQSATTARVLVNGVQVIASVAFPLTSSWSTWTTTADATVTLVAGANKIRLETTAASEFAMIDWIEITGNAPTEASCSAATGSRIIAQNTQGRQGEQPSEIIPLVEAAPVVLPNPSGGQSTLKLTLATEQQLMVKVFTADGRLVKQVANRVFAPGIHYVPLDNKALKAGVYFISVDNGVKARLVQHVIMR